MIQLSDGREQTCAEHLKGVIRLATESEFHSKEVELEREGVFEVRMYVLRELLIN